MSNLTVRQLIEGMPLVFNSASAGDLAATIQFDVSGAETGQYCLEIANGACRFNLGAATTPSLTIETPAEVWQAISTGELDGQDALMAGRYSAKGDLNILLQMGNLFGSLRDSSFEQADNPPGPLQISGMTWLSIAFIPWIFLWVTFDLGISRLIPVGVPLLFSAGLVLYRQKFGGATWLERGTLLFFIVAAAFCAADVPWFLRWGSILGTFWMSGLWLGSLVRNGMTLSAEYSRWSYIPAMWTNSMFTHTNAIITLMWGFQFIAAALFGILAILVPQLFVVGTVARYLLLIPAFVFTHRQQAGSATTRIDDPEGDMVKFRKSAIVGLVIIVGIIIWTITLS